MSYGFYVVFIQGLGALGPVIAGFVVTKIGLTNMLLVTQAILFVSAFFFILAGFSYVKDFNKARAAEKSALS